MGRFGQPDSDDDMTGPANPVQTAPGPTDPQTGPTDPQTGPANPATEPAAPPAQELPQAVLQAINDATRPLQTHLRDVTEENQRLNAMMNFFVRGAQDAATRTPKGPKINPPPAFYGRTPKDKDKEAEDISFEEWSQKVRLYVRMRPQEFEGRPMMACIWAASLLRGPAEKWARPHTTAALSGTDIPAIMTDLDLFLQSLQSAFGRPNVKRAAGQELVKLRQGKDTVSEYASKFKALRTESETDMGVTGLMLLFENGLNNQFRYDLASKEIEETDDFDLWVRKLCEFDEDLRARRTGFRPNNWGQQGSYRPHAYASASRGQAKDPDAMDIDRMSTEEMMRKGLCFQCGEHGHLARKCPQKGKQPAGRSKVASQTATPTLTTAPSQDTAPAAASAPTASLEEVRDETPSVNSVRGPSVDDIAKAVAAALHSQGF